VAIFPRLVREAVEEFMELGESRSLQVPMSLFVGGRQGRHVRQIQVQPTNESFLAVPVQCRSLLASFRAFHVCTHGRSIWPNAASGLCCAANGFNRPGTGPSALGG